MEFMLILIISCSIISFAQPDFLQNPDFELPPANLAENLTSTFVTLQENNTIPGWSFEGLVQYVISGKDVQLPGNGHAILLGEDGKINQTFKADSNNQRFLLTFTMSLGGQSCVANASLIVSAPDSEFHFSLKQNYSKGHLDSYGHQLGSWGGAEEKNLVLQSEAIDIDPNSTCWPIVDSLRVKAVDPTLNDGLLNNGGFEVGPPFLETSSEGVLLDSVSSQVQSALQPWTVTGTIKYINSKNYFIPEGDAAVELVSGAGAGIQTTINIPQDSSHVLEFMLGDANDSCLGEFVVGVYAGSSTQNFSIQSAGTGSSKKYSIPFKGGSDRTSIIFQSYRTSRREDGIFCGPVIDDVVLHSSGALGHNFPVAIFLVLALVHLGWF
ncbi:hypothetical protein LIER_09816 [Lithospermum erythrorhizon]|uniref:DUF642 domain-containing protein n=1 Tax=Lithospermum erythrorhizon TaxID=34254 RepID=A0AAV3PH79_LITER